MIEILKSVGNILLGKEEGVDDTVNLELLRFSSQDDYTLGILFSIFDGIRRFLCFTCEDEYRTKKVYGETRIPSGNYRIELRLEGGFHQRYTQKFPDMHMGMLHLCNVPNFEYVLIHIGNSDDDTAGCILVGDTAGSNWIGNSTATYKRIYPPIASSIFSGGARIKIIDYDTPIPHPSITRHA